MNLIVNLKTEGKDTPLNLEVLKPRFSWQLEVPSGFEQGAYRILVATTSSLLGEADLWDSGKVQSGERTFIDYAGAPLSARAECFWSVEVWDAANCSIGVSEPARFRMGLIEKSNWTAKWIGYDREAIAPFDPHAKYYAADDFEKGTNTLHLPPVPYLRKEFFVSKPVRNAIVYVSALGLYELRMNGTKIGDAFFTPGWSDYGKRVYYDAYELDIAEGNNVIGALLADGWYAGYVGLVSRHTWGDQPRMVIQLEIEYQDGTFEIVSTDESWQAAYGDLREADLLHGELADARDRIAGWDTTECKDSRWDAPVVSAFPDLLIQPHVGPYNRIIEEIAPKLIKEFSDGSFLYDVGKNITGFMRLNQINEKRGERISFEFAEVLNNDGDIDRRVYRSARAMDIYVSGGSTDESFQPKFTFRGFRYVKISGLSRKPEDGSLFGIFVSSDIKQIGEFNCSDRVINDVFEMLKQTIHCGYLEVPMDCCERDERLGWGQDGNHSLRLGSYLFDISAFQSKWQNDILDSQKEDGSMGPTAPFIDMGDIGQFSGDIMADSGLHNAWIQYMMYGDREIVRRSYDALKLYFGFMQKNSDRNMRNSITGDWLQLLKNNRTDFIHGWGDTARDLMGTAFYAFGTDIMCRFAQELGETDDYESYHAQYLATRKAFQNTFELREHHFRDATQTGYALALYFNLLSDDMRGYVAKYLADDVRTHNDSLTTGIAGSAYVLQALSDNGYHDTAVRTMSSDEYPGFGYMVRMGATTCWERWDSLHKEYGAHPHVMNSYSHIGLSSAGAWLFQKIGGIEPLEPGFRRVKIAPCTDGSLTSADVAFTCIYGKINVSWEKNADGTHYCIAIPPNVTAEVLIPAAKTTIRSDRLIDDGKSEDTLRFIAKSGTHNITVR